jgi:hypothetical protein
MHSLEISLAIAQTRKRVSTYNVDDSIIELHRVAYDIATAKRKIREAGLFD